MGEPSKKVFLKAFKIFIVGESVGVFFALLSAAAEGFEGLGTGFVAIAFILLTPLAVLIYTGVSLHKLKKEGLETHALRTIVHITLKLALVAILGFSVLFFLGFLFSEAKEFQRLISY